MQIVLDTNVLISALLSPYQAPATILRMLLSNKIKLLYDERIMQEYEEVLSRPKFNFDNKLTDPILTLLRDQGTMIDATTVQIKLPDPDDLMFIEVAISGLADYLITGNTKHYPTKILKPYSVKIIAPENFVKLFAN